VVSSLRRLWFISYNQQDLALALGWSVPSASAVDCGLSATKVKRMTLSCPNCGNERNFQVKTLQVHVVRLEDARVEVQEENRPAVLEMLCDECETEMKFEEVDEAVRKEVLLTLGAR
jgi:RNase P subunit RPR2